MHVDSAKESRYWQPYLAFALSFVYSRVQFPRTRVQETLHYRLLRVIKYVGQKEVPSCQPAEVSTQLSEIFLDASRGRSLSIATQ